MNDDRIVSAIESNLFEFYWTVATFSGRPYYSDPFLSWVNCAPSRWPSTIFAANFLSADAEEKICFVKDSIRSGKAPNSWSIGPSTNPEELAELLVRNGFEKVWGTAGMGMELSELKDGIDAPPGLEITVVSDERDLRDWSRVVAVGLFGCAESEVVHFYELMRTLQDCDRLKLYLGRLSGRAAGSVTLFQSLDGVAGIYHVATLPEFRRRGIGRCVTLAPLVKARDAGAKAAILQATTLGEPVYRRLGFRTLCTLARYRLAE